jgi:hypothetical protein
MVMAGGRPGYRRLQLQAVGQEAGPKPPQAKQGAVTVCLGDSTGQTAPWWRRSRRKRKRRRSLQQKPEVWKRAHRGEVARGEGDRGGRRQLGVTTFRSWCPHNTPVR